MKLTPVVTLKQVREMTNFDHRITVFTSNLIDERAKNLSSQQWNDSDIRAFVACLKNAQRLKTALYPAARLREDFFTADMRSFDR